MAIMLRAGSALAEFDGEVEGDVFALFCLDDTWCAESYVGLRLNRFHRWRDSHQGLVALGKLAFGAGDNGSLRFRKPDGALPQQPK